MTRTDSAQLLEQLYRDTLTAIQPGRAVREALDGNFTLDAERRDAVHILAFGKASVPMCRAALEWFTARHVVVHGGLCVSVDGAGVAAAPLTTCVGDHPVPGSRSADAAAALDAYVTTRVDAGAHVLVLLSGGTSSLIGAPLDTSQRGEYGASMHALLVSGLDITQVNRQRRQLSQWGGGRLGAALQARGASVTVLVISDVIGDDLASIGSGPCIPVLRNAMDAIPHLVISSNRAARDAVVSLAASRELPIAAVAGTLQGDVRDCAERITTTLVAHAIQWRGHAPAQQPRLLCWGGEPTVTLPADAPAGGRMQALALHIARGLQQARHGMHDVTVLAAGTDGRDGATDAAGAVIDSRSWDAILRTGRAPDQDLVAFRSHAALGSIGALIPAFASGTNVNDLVIALVG